MSAWIVSRAHIDVLVQGLAESEIVTHLDPDELGRVLWRENLASVAYRYPGDTGDGDRPGPTSFRDEHVETYTYRRPTQKIDHLGLLWAVACYGYQSCEHPDWESSDAAKWATTLRTNLGRVLGSEELTGERPWGYDEDDVHGVSV